VAVMICRTRVLRRPSAAYFRAHSSCHLLRVSSVIVRGQISYDFVRSSVCTSAGNGCAREQCERRATGDRRETASQRRNPPQVADLVPFVVSEPGGDEACGSCGKRVLCVFQGAVGAFLASTAPATSIGDRRRAVDFAHARPPRRECHHGPARQQRPPQTRAATGTVVEHVPWGVAPRAPVQG
jgi:hypothetical protein